MKGGTGPDRSRNGGVTVDLSTNTDSDHDTLSGFEDVAGSFANDNLTDDEGLNQMFGITGNDRIKGLAGDDHLVGGKGEDTINGGAGNDTCRTGEHVSNCEAAKSSSRALGERHWQLPPLSTTSNP